MTLSVDIPVSSSVSEVLDTVSIREGGFSDILHSIGDAKPVKDLFAEAGPRKAWHAEHADVLARCDLSEQHVHLFPKVGLRIIAVWKRTVKGPTLADIKADDGIPYREDVAIARTKQRIGVDFEPGNIPPETNLICFDDFVTTGSTLGAMNRLLAPMGKNIFYIVGVDNQ